MEKPDKKNKAFADLKASLLHLIREYRSARDLINDQIQAVIYSDLVWLDSLVEQQLAKYELLEQLEVALKEKIEQMFEDHNPEQNEYSLTLLIEKLEEPSDELNRLRGELHQQVEKTLQLREQLTELLQFASKHNAETLEGIFQLDNPEAESYNADGKKETGLLNSIVINQKA